MRMQRVSAYPPDCNPATQSWWTTVKSWIGFGDNCFEYYREQLSETYEKVSFLQAFMETNLMVFITEPMKAIVTAVSTGASTLAG